MGHIRQKISGKSVVSTSQLFLKAQALFKFLSSYFLHFKNVKTFNKKNWKEKKHSYY